MAPARHDHELGRRISAQGNLQSFRMVKADQLILTTGDQKHRRHEMARRRCWRGNAEIDAQEEATPQRHQLDVGVPREAEPFV
jgi:hypothetical protein